MSCEYMSNILTIFIVKNAPSTMNDSFINSEYKQFDGEKEYYNKSFQLQHRNVTTCVWKPIFRIFPLLHWNKLSICCLNTCNFHRKFRFTFALFSLSQMCILEKLDFKISQGNLDPSSVLAPSDFNPNLAGPTLNCFRRARETANLWSLIA